MARNRKKRTGSPQTISASEFKTRCLELMDRVQQDRNEIVVTKYGKPVAKLVPFQQEPASILGFLEGTVTFHGDVVEPTGEIWEADAD
ncbi:MAG: type II toxin-antitoxin system Phd/YefM family antitoxin [Gemmatimonadota bacterium]|nr:type II toxin-antitoxin system Phd/YefM family antitoxin [Gemmatimonadota bacterium]